jgi:hypothetical protein
MSAERAFAAFVAAWERGEQPDPAAAIAAARESDREPLAAMLAAYLAANPRTDVTEEQVVARAADPRSDPPRAWPDLLPALRARTGTTRGALVAHLAEALGHPEARAQVDEHVHDLETGQLAAARVRPPVVAAMARILQVPEALLEMGRRIVPSPTLQLPQIDMAFHREAPAAAPPPAVADAADAAPRVAEIDDLFTGGG